MLTLSAANTIAGVAGTNSAVTYNIFGMTLNAGVETYDVLAQGQLSTSAGTVYTVPGATTAFIKQISLVNTTGTQVTGVKLYINGTAASNQFTGSFTLPANGTAMLDDDGLSVYDQYGSLLSAVLSQTATALSGASALPNATTATTQAPLDNSTKVATTAYADAAVAAYSAANSTISQVTVDLGAVPRKAGTFTITGSGWTIGRQVFVQMASSRPNQTLSDAIQLDQIVASGVVTSSTTIKVNWGSRTYVSNQYTFNYWLAT